jgi:hypothetical protein
MLDVNVVHGDPFEVVSCQWVVPVKINHGAPVTKTHATGLIPTSGLPSPLFSSDMLKRYKSDIVRAIRSVLDAHTPHLVLDAVFAERTTVCADDLYLLLGSHELLMGNPTLRGANQTESNHGYVCSGLFFVRTLKYHTPTSIQGAGTGASVVTRILTRARARAAGAGAGIVPASACTYQYSSSQDIPPQYVYTRRSPYLSSLLPLFLQMRNHNLSPSRFVALVVGLGQHH